MGCIFCSRWMQSQVDVAASRRCGVKRKRGCRDGNTKWARFEINAVSQVAMRGICQHANTSMHRQAVRHFFAPDLLRMRACRTVSGNQGRGTAQSGRGSRGRAGEPGGGAARMGARFDIRFRWGTRRRLTGQGQLHAQGEVGCA